MNSNKKYIWALIVLLILAGAWYCINNKTVPNAEETTSLPSEKEVTQTPSVKIDEHLTINDTLREVTFCGTTYKTIQAVIDGVDVVQRIAELAIEDSEPENVKGRDQMNKIFCEKDFNYYEPKDTLFVQVGATQITATEKSDSQYMLVISGLGFIIDTVTGRLYLFGGEYGSELIGALK